MSAIILPRRWSQQPSGRIRIANYWLDRKLVGVRLWNEIPVTTRDEANDAAWALNLANYSTDKATPCSLGVAGTGWGYALQSKSGYYKGINNPYKVSGARGSVVGGILAAVASRISASQWTATLGHWGSLYSDGTNIMLRRADTSSNTRDWLSGVSTGMVGFAWNGNMQVQPLCAVNGAAVTPTSSGSGTGAVTVYDPKLRIGLDDVAGQVYGPCLWFMTDLLQAELNELTRNPWQVAQRDKLVLYSFASSAAQLAGAPAAQSTAAGALTTQIPLTGAAAVLATASGALSTAIPLAGQAAAVSLASGVLTTQITLQGAALAQALASAGLSTAIALDANAAAVAAAVGGLTTQISLSGSALAQALASGDLAGGAASLSGAAAAQASIAGSLLTQIPLAGTAQAYATAAGGLTTLIPLAGAAASVSSASGALTLEVGLSGAALAQALAAGSLTTVIRLDGAALAQAAAIGTLGAGSGTLPVQEHYLVRAAARATRIRASDRVVALAAPTRQYRIAA